MEALGCARLSDYKLNRELQRAFVLLRLGLRVQGFGALGFSKGLGFRVLGFKLGFRV